MYQIESLAGGYRVVCYGCCVVLRVNRARMRRVFGKDIVCSRCGQD